MNTNIIESLATPRRFLASGISIVTGATISDTPLACIVPLVLYPDSLDTAGDRIFIEIVTKSNGNSLPTLL